MDLISTENMRQKHKDNLLKYISAVSVICISKEPLDDS